MSSFAFMSFAMAMVNGAINTANNVNNNNNNNNNNDNNNNNNVANINIANANNNANNMNMATAGRRRRKIVSGSLNQFENQFEPGEIISEQESENVTSQYPYPALNISAAALNLSGEKYAIKAIRVGYVDDNKNIENSDKNIENSEQNIEKAEDNSNIFDDDDSNIFYEVFELLNQKSLAEPGSNLLEEISQFLEKFDVESLPIKVSEFLLEKLPKIIPENVSNKLKQGSDVLQDVLEALGKRRRRSIENISTFAEVASLIALIYIDLFLRLIGSDEKPECVSKYFCQASKSGKLLGIFSENLSTLLSDFAADLLIPKYWIDPNFLKNVTNLARNEDFDCEEKFSEC
jgi:hypothetical protein